MLFNSYIFILLFLPTTFTLYFYLNHKRMTEAGRGVLLFASLVFYSWWNISHLPIILTSILFNYIIGVYLSRPAVNNKYYSRDFLLIVGILGNLLPLIFFKYLIFFITTVNSDIPTNIPLQEIALPLAISFYTFQQIAYLIDSYRRETSEYNFLNYVVSVTFFPQLIVGPIVYHK